MKRTKKEPTVMVLPVPSCDIGKHRFFFGRVTKEERKLEIFSVVCCKRCTLRVGVTNILTDEEAEWARVAAQAYAQTIDRSPEVRMFWCFTCDHEVEVERTGGDWSEVDCSDCGQILEEM